MQHLKPDPERIAFLTVFCLFGLVSLLLTGCTQPSESAAEEEHLEHHIPEHKPRSYTETVKELDSRMRWLLNHSQKAEIPQKQQELAEIIDWVPELAADSELKHKDWNEVQQLSTEIKSVFQQTDFSQVDATLVGRYFLLVDKLKQYTGRSETKKFQS